MSDRCISCGMPLRVPEDHAAADPARDYCRHCARPDGSMKSYDEVLTGMTQFFVRTQGLDAAVAEGMAKQNMSAQPAWRSVKAQA
jgi:hypothetical protein